MAPLACSHLPVRRAPRSRAARTTQGLIAAVFSTFVALFSHILAGGTVPGPLGVMVPLILSTAACVLLATVRWSPIRLSLSVSASQFLFHSLFVLGAPTAPVPRGHAGHAVDTALMVMDSATIPPMSSAHSGLEMWLGHVVAALITIAALRRSETVMVRIAAVTESLLARFTRAIPDVDATWLPRLRGPNPFVTATARLSLGFFPSALSRRGPPAVF